MYMKYRVADNGYTQIKYKYLKIVLKGLLLKKTCLHIKVCLQALRSTTVNCTGAYITHSDKENLSDYMQLSLELQTASFYFFTYAVVQQKNLSHT